MPDRREDLEDWLGGGIEPLPPPPGTFDLIRRRARRRKYRKLAVGVGAAAVIVTAALTVPQMVNLPVLNSTSATSAANAHPAGRAASAPSGRASTSSQAASPVPSAAGGPVPANFQPTSVTFVGLDTGWAIGQAGTPGHCATQYCTSLARTDDAGDTWTGVPAPLAGAPNGATGVSGIRFLNLSDGWAFGPELFATHNGGQTWTRIGTHGMRVTDVETAGDRAFALFASCTGGGAAFAASCTSFTLYSSPAGSDDWAPVGPSTSGLTPGPRTVDGKEVPGQADAASIVLTGTTGYLLAPDSMLYAGPVNGSAPWQAVARVPCRTGTAQADGQPAGVLLGATNATNLIFACTPSATVGGMQKKLIFTSADGGASWSEAYVAPAAGVAASLAASPAETLIVGTNQGIDVLPAGSTSWQQASVTGAPAGGFAFVGMTTATQGVALPADGAAGAVWFTYDGGQTWTPSKIS
jgi:photosystem II stability/assembly factor-like uncharacterized protein